MGTYENLLLKVFSQLAEQWQAEFTIEEIARDQAKVALMLEVLESAGSQELEVPGVLDDLYERVFLRDVWIAKRKDRNSPH